MWGGSFFYNITYLQVLAEGFAQYNTDHPQDPESAATFAVAYAAVLGGYIINMQLENAQPVANPPLLKSFTNVPRIFDTGRITNMTDLAIELKSGQPSGS